MNENTINNDLIERRRIPYRGILCVICSISIVWVLYLLFFIHLLYETLDLSNVTIYD